MRNYFSIMSFRKNTGNGKEDGIKVENKKQNGKNESCRQPRVERRGIEATENRKKTPSLSVLKMSTFGKK